MGWSGGVGGMGVQGGHRVSQRSSCKLCLLLFLPGITPSPPRCCRLCHCSQARPSLVPGASLSWRLSWRRSVSWRLASRKTCWRQMAHQPPQLPQLLLRGVTPLAAARQGARQVGARRAGASPPWWRCCAASGIDSGRGRRWVGGCRRVLYCLAGAPPLALVLLLSSDGLLIRVCCLRACPACPACRSSSSTWAPWGRN